MSSDHDSIESESKPFRGGSFNNDSSGLEIVRNDKPVDAVSNHSTSTFNSRMAGMRSRLKGSTLSIFGENTNNRVDLIKKQSSQLVAELSKHAHEKFENFYTLADEVGQGAHAIVYKCIKKN